MTEYTPYGLQRRIMQKANELDCVNTRKAMQGKSSPETDKQVFELMFIHKLLPYLNGSQIREKECYLNDKFGL